jgi:hypothetical protein
MWNEPLVDLGVEVGDGVLDAEDVHQFLGKGAGNCSVTRMVSLVIQGVPHEGCEKVWSCAFAVPRFG